MSAYETYQSVSAHVGSFGVVAFVVGFALVLIYALTPRNGADFNRAAHSILESDRDDKPQ